MCVCVWINACRANRGEVVSLWRVGWHTEACCNLITASIFLMHLSLLTCLKVQTLAMMNRPLWMKYPVIYQIKVNLLSLLMPGRWSVCGHRIFTAATDRQKHFESAQLVQYFNTKSACFSVKTLTMGLPMIFPHRLFSKQFEGTSYLIIHSGSSPEVPWWKSGQTAFLWAIMFARANLQFGAHVVQQCGTDKVI